MINVTKTYLPDKETYKSYIDRIFESGWLTNNGQFVQELEQKLCEYLGVNYLVLITNGTLALQVAYKVLNLTGEVITTPFSFVATTSSLVWDGLKPVFSDIETTSLCIDPNLIEEKITEHTSAILPVHVYGNACDVEKIQEIAGRNNLKVIYDAAHAFGVHYKNESILNYGDASILSFHATKLFHTVEGGAIIFKHEDDYIRAKKMINFGIIKPEIIDGIGINAKMNEFQAAMGLCVLDDVEEIKNSRKEAFEYYLECLHESTELPKISPYQTQNYSYFPILLKSESSLKVLERNLLSKKVVSRRYFYHSLNQLEYLTQNDSCPISEDVSKRILCLPLFYNMDKQDIKRICEEVLKVFTQ